MFAEIPDMALFLHFVHAVETLDANPNMPIDETIKTNFTELAQEMKKRELVVYH